MFEEESPRFPATTTFL